MTDTSSISISLSLKIGLGVLDGGSYEWLAKTYAVSEEDVEQSWHLCREALSRHFANAEGHEFKLLSDNELRERLEDTLRLLIDWRGQALQDELVATLTPETNDSSDGAEDV